jgi:signal transduction histidine kinase
MAIGSDDIKAGAGAMDAELVVPSLLHELKQPLQGADAAAALLERSMGGLRATEEWRILRVQLARLAEIVNGYEDLLRPGDAEPAPFAVAPVVSRAVDLLAHRVRPLARRFLFASKDGTCSGYGAPAALVHAATNLLVNALDAIEGAGKDARVEVRILPVRGGAEVRVSDEGVGIPAEHRAHIFEPRFTTKGAQRGSGLGLHVARRLMSRYGGEVFLVDERDPARLPWAVTEFCISVPPPPAREAL